MSSDRTLLLSIGSNLFLRAEFCASIQVRIWRFAMHNPNVTAAVTLAKIKTISIRQFSVLCAILLRLSVPLGSGESHYECVRGVSSPRGVCVGFA